MSSQVTVDLAEIRRVVGEANELCQNLSFAAEDSKTGLQLMEHWLPEPIKMLLVEEHLRPDGEKTRVALVKYFNPYGGQTWYASEYDPETDNFYGYVDPYIPGMAELGYFNNQELRGQRVPPFRLPLERDLWFEPRPLSEIREAGV